MMSEPFCDRAAARTGRRHLRHRRIPSFHTETLTNIFTILTRAPSVTFGATSLPEGGFRVPSFLAPTLVVGFLLWCGSRNGGSERCAAYRLRQTPIEEQRTRGILRNAEMSAERDAKRNSQNRLPTHSNTRLPRNRPLWSVFLYNESHAIVAWFERG